MMTAKKLEMLAGKVRYRIAQKDLQMISRKRKESFQKQPHYSNAIAVVRIRKQIDEIY